MKKFCLWLLALSLLLGLSSCAEEEPVGSSVAVENMYPVYILGKVPFRMSLNFLNGVNDLPYVEVDDMIYLFNHLFHVYDKKTQLAVSKSGNVVTCARSSEAYGVDTTMTIDFAADVIRFEDFNIFTMLPCRSTILDLTSLDFFDKEGNPRLIERVKPKYLPRLGGALEINLAKYGIDLVVADGKYLIPLQTFSDILVAPTFLNSCYFNGEAVIVAGNMAASPDPAAPNVDRELYYKGKTGERSATLAKFGYNELCLALDTLYGLKDLHGIESFDQLFQSQGAVSMSAAKSFAADCSLKAYLTGSSVFDADKAIYHLIGDFLDDNHSKWYNFSYLAGEHDGYKPNGASRERLEAYKKAYADARDKAYPSGVPAYQEVGDTAFVTFDAFAIAQEFAQEPDDLDKYYTTPLDQLPDKDTMALIMKAHDKITANPNIKNVVIDLSVNGGGYADAAVFVAAWFLGELSISMEYTTTGAMCATSYRCDANRDHLFDQNDTLGDRRLFCLVSPYSFSCGNLVPNLFKESEKVTILGKTSGGGACVVQPISSAWGTSFRISGPQRLCYIKNGSYYDIDRGAEPDYYIADPETHFDRDAINTIINNL